MLSLPSLLSFHVWIYSFFSNTASFPFLSSMEQESSAGCCSRGCRVAPLCSASHSADYRGWMRECRERGGGRGGGGDPPTTTTTPHPLSAQYMALSGAQPMATHSIHDWLMQPIAAHTWICNSECQLNSIKVTAMPHKNDIFISGFTVCGSFTWSSSIESSKWRLCYNAKEQCKVTGAF